MTTLGESTGIPIQVKTRGEIRRLIGSNIGDCIKSTATTTTDTSSLIDTYGLSLFSGDDTLIGRQVQIYEAAGSIAAYEKSFVSDYAGSTKDATVSPVFTAAITSGDKYEMWKTFTVEDVNDQIDLAIMAVTDRCLLKVVDETVYSETSKYKYPLPTDLTGLFRVDYVSNTGIEYTIHKCDVVWDELVDGDVTATAETGIVKEGDKSLKLVVAAPCAAGDKLATDSISSLDLSDCDEIEIWIRSTTALNAGDIQLLLDNTALCASPVETLSIPATSANVWTRHVISLANPESDTAIISVGLKMNVDKGAFTLYADDIKAVVSGSRIYETVNPDQWRIVKGATKYIEFSASGKSVIGENHCIRLNGYQIPTLPSTDSSTLEIDSYYIVAFCTSKLLLSHAKSALLTVADRENLGGYWTNEADKRYKQITTTLEQGTRMC